MCIYIYMCVCIYTCVCICFLYFYSHSPLHIYVYIYTYAYMYLIPCSDLISKVLDWLLVFGIGPLHPACALLELNQGLFRSSARKCQDPRLSHSSSRQSMTASCTATNALELQLQVSDFQARSKVLLGSSSSMLATEVNTKSVVLVG